MEKVSIGSGARPDITPLDSRPVHEFLPEPVVVRDVPTSTGTIVVLEYRHY